jgi:hypothetical protein
MNKKLLLIIVTALIMQTLQVDASASAGGGGGGAAAPSKKYSYTTWSPLIDSEDNEFDRRLAEKAVIENTIKAYHTYRSIQDTNGYQQAARSRSVDFSASHLAKPNKSVTRSSTAKVITNQHSITIINQSSKQKTSAEIGAKKAQSFAIIQLSFFKKDPTTEEIFYRSGPCLLVPGAPKIVTQFSTNQSDWLRELSTEENMYVAIGNKDKILQHIIMGKELPLVKIDHTTAVTLIINAAGIISFGEPTADSLPAKKAFLIGSSDRHTITDQDYQSAQSTSTAVPNRPEKTTAHIDKTTTNLSFHVTLTNHFGKALNIPMTFFEICQNKDSARYNYENYVIRFDDLKNSLNPLSIKKNKDSMDIFLILGTYKNADELPANALENTLLWCISDGQTCSLLADKNGNVSFELKKCANLFKSIKTSDGERFLVAYNQNVYSGGGDDDEAARPAPAAAAVNEEDLRLEKDFTDAIKNENIDQLGACCQLLQAKNIDINSFYIRQPGSKKKSKTLLLHYAASIASTEAIKYLVTAEGADINEINSHNNRNILHYVAQYTAESSKMQTMLKYLFHDLEIQRTINFKDQDKNKETPTDTAERCLDKHHEQKTIFLTALQCEHLILEMENQ